MNWRELEQEAMIAAEEARRHSFESHTINDLRRWRDEAEKAGEHGVADEIARAFDRKMAPHA
jgi:DNA-binding IclR family transcriptional regulator